MSAFICKKNVLHFFGLKVLNSTIHHCQSMMDFRSHLLAIAGFLSLTLILAFNLWRRTRTGKHKHQIGKSLPELSGAWPLIGHLHLLGDQKPLARTFAKFADELGPIFKIRLGVHPAVVISNWEAVKECFTSNDRALAARPVSSHGKYLGYDFAAFGFVSYGPFWREMRKLALVEVLSGRRLEKLRRVRVSEIEMSINELYAISQSNNVEPLVISQWIEQLTLNIIVRMIAGKRYFDGSVGLEDEEARRFRRVIKEFMHISGEFVLSDVIPLPFLSWMDFQGSIKSMKRISKELDSVFDGWLREHIQKTEKNETEADASEEQDFLDVMLSVIDDEFFYGYTRETIIKATTLNLILAGADTTAIHLTWLLCLLLNNRHVMKQAQQELDVKVGKDRWVQESDTTELVYLQSIVKEALRVYPPGPLAVPHEAMEDCQVGGFHIPKGTRLFVNVWKLHRDPRIWTHPDDFRPERFLTQHSEVDVSGQHFEFIPFGSGRRSCPGIQFASQVTHLTLARLLQGFEITTPSNEAVDMSEGMGVTLPRATPLEVLLTPRLAAKLYGP